MRLLRVFRYLPLFILIFGLTAHAGTLNYSTVGMFPKDVSEFGYADVGLARQFSWFPQFEAQLVPVALFNFEAFLDVAQMKQTPSIEQVAWGRLLADSKDSENSADGNGQIIGIATGKFDAGAIQSFLDSHNVQGVEIGNTEIYGAGTASGASDIFFTLIDNETIAFAPLAAMERLLAVRSGQRESLLQNEELMALFNQANGDGIFWGILSSSGAQAAIQHLLPDASKFSQGKDLVGSMKHALISVKAPSDIELSLRITLTSPKNALLLSQVLQAGMLYEQYQASDGNADLAEMLKRVGIDADGNQIVIAFDLTDEQVLDLIEHNTFSPPT